VWDPGAYLRYGDERSRPFYDLLARVPAERPAAVVDLGCGPGNLTGWLAERWPEAQVTGLDSSPDMIAKARTLDTRVDFEVGDVRDWAPDRVDVVVCNAVLQWVPGHETLLERWAGQLPRGAWLAVQVPGNFDADSHRALRAVAADRRWQDRITPLLREVPVLDAVGYTTLLSRAGCAVDAWETTYVHLLPARDRADHPVLTWMEGTALRPVREALLSAGAGWPDFREALGARLARAYPLRDGQVYFPFRRVFFVARTGVRP
jgi:trans-aconitate 2-methyltransferase